MKNASALAFCYHCMLYKGDGQGLDDGKSFITKLILDSVGFDPAFFFINTSN